MVDRRTRIGAPRIFFPLLLLALTGSSRAELPQKQEIVQLLEMHRYPQAEQAATAYLKVYPGDCSAGVLLGLALRGEARLEPAYKTFHAVMDRCPQSLPAVEGAAESAFLLHRTNTKELLSKVLALRPGDETSHAMLGAVDARTGDCAGAVENYGKASSRIEQNVPALKQYGGCLLALNRPSEAVTVLAQLLPLQDDHVNRVALARAQAKAGDTKAALATLQPLLTPGVRDSDALLLAAQLAEAGNDTPQAVAWLRQAMEANPRNVDAYLVFSEVSFNHGAFKVGIDFLDVGIRELPREARLYLARGILEVQSSQTDAALRDFEHAHRLDPQLSFAEDARGMLFTQKHDSAAALALFRKQSRLHPKDSLVQYLYAEALSEAPANADSALIEEALKVAAKAVKLDPGYQAARDLLCVLLLRHNDLNAVVQQTEEALRRDPYDEVALYQAMLAEHKLNHMERSKALVKRLQDAKTHNQQAKEKYLIEERDSPSRASN